MISSNMSGPSKSLDKNKRFAGVKTNEFVNKTRANETNRSTVRPQGWANLGKINSRRIPPPANLPSLKSETGIHSATFDPTLSSNHTWTSNENSLSPNSQIHSTQQIDSLPVNSSGTLISTIDNDKVRLTSTWNTITSVTQTMDQTANHLGLNDFPHLTTTSTLQEKNCQNEPNSTSQNQTFRPANLSTWKDGGATTNRTSTSAIHSNNPGANLYQQPENMRIYQTQMWNYNSHQPVPLMTQRINQFNDYKTPTILRNKDIDDLSKLTDNTWANTTQEVNYEEKIRFSDDDDDVDDDNNNNNNNNNNDNYFQTNTKLSSHLSNHSRLIQDDQHLKQMQDNKNSELINTLNLAKQRRDEQERHLRDEQKSTPGYPTRPLISSTTQNNEHDNSIARSNQNSSSFTMKSWSDQMDSFNYSSPHEISTAHEHNRTNQFSPTQSESSCQSLSKQTQFLPSNQSIPFNQTNQKQQINSTLKTKPVRSTKQSTTKLRSNQQQQQQQQQQQHSNTYKTNKQHYQSSTFIDTSTIPPLMSVRSDLSTTNFYPNENLYYDINHQRYQQTNTHNRPYTTSDNYGRYRQNGTNRQQQYPNYQPTTVNNRISSAPNNRTKNSSNLNPTAQCSNSNDDIQTDSLLNNDQSMIKSFQSIDLTANQVKTTSHEQKSLQQTKQFDKKTSNIKTQRRTNKDKQYQIQQPTKHRTAYSRAMQEYHSAHNYYNTNRRTGQATRHNQQQQHDLSSAYYYDQSQTHYNNPYNYSNDSYHQQSKSLTHHKRQQTTNKTATNNNNNMITIRHHSTSDNEQKEGEEWETASESSTNMRNGHYEHTAMNEMKSNHNHRGRTPTKKTFANQRPNARQILKYTNA